MKLIKRYKNRRLYDTDRKKHITFQELALIVNSRIPFKVIENATGEDITLQVLARLLVEQAKKWDDIVDSKEILIETINLGGKRSMSILRNTYLAGLGIFNLSKQKAEEVIDSLIQAGQISQSDRNKAVMELLDKAEESAKKMKDRVVKESGNVQTEINKLSEKVKNLTDRFRNNNEVADELRALSDKVDELAKRVESSE